MKKCTQKSKKWKIVGIILCSILVALLIGGFCLSIVIYKDNFGSRFESYPPLMYSVDDFEGLNRTKYTFPSDKGQKLVGYKYWASEEEKGIIVLAHGFGGGGHNSYMDCINYFAQNGYVVFAYDATGNDESEGEGVGGMPQGVIDLDYAISFVENSSDFSDLPIFLFGHSWGAYCVCSVLTYHPEVNAVIACSGFNSSADIIEAQGKKEVGNGIYLILPFVKAYEHIIFGKYAANTAMEGFASTAAKVMILHSRDDSMVPIQYGYDKYYAEYKDDPRFSFIRFEDKGHDYFNAGTTYMDEFNVDFDKWRENLEYDPTDPENSERFIQDKMDYINQNLDRKKWSNRLDEDLFKEFVKFYDENR